MPCIYQKKDWNTNKRLFKIHFLFIYLHTNVGRIWYDGTLNWAFTICGLINKVLMKISINCPNNRQLCVNTLNECTLLTFLAVQTTHPNQLRWYITSFNFQSHIIADDAFRPRYCDFLKIGYFQNILSEQNNFTLTLADIHVQHLYSRILWKCNGINKIRKININERVIIQYN